MTTNDPNGPYEGRSDMREATRLEFEQYRREHPDGDWSISALGDAPERFFVPLATRADALWGVKESRLSVVLTKQDYLDTPDD